MLSKSSQTRICVSLFKTQEKAGTNQTCSSQQLSAFLPSRWYSLSVNWLKKFPTAFFLFPSRYFIPVLACKDGLYSFSERLWGVLDPGIKGSFQKQGYQCTKLPWQSPLLYIQGIFYPHCLSYQCCLKGGQEQSVKSI